MRKATGPSTTKTDSDRDLMRATAGGGIDAGNWAWSNSLDQLVDMLERAVARSRMRAASSDLTGN